jgi:ATP-dependent helicase/nuclease subunit A
MTKSRAPTSWSIPVAIEPRTLAPGGELDEDAAARSAAVDTRTSFLLQAPAGSGKTTVLTCRLLALLATVAEPEEVLAITFTRKAASEMRDRVLGALRRAAAGEPGDKPEAPFAESAWRHSQQRGWRLLESPTRLRIMTIDAFCHNLCAQLPIASRNGLRLEIAEPARPLYAAASRRTLEMALADPVLSEPARLLFARLDNDWSRFEALLELMLERRAHWLPRMLASEGASAGLAALVEGSVRSVIEARLAAIVAAIPRALLEQGAALAAHAARTLRAEGREVDPALLEALPAPRALAGDLPRWRALCALALTSGGEWRARWDRRHGLLPGHAGQKQQLAEWVAGLEAQPGARELLNEALALPDVAVPADDAAALAALSQLLQRAAAELQLEFASQGRVDYVAVAAAARAALTENGQPTDLALRCGSALRHVLVDEFQDTSYEQYQLLLALTAGWEPADGRTLFLVGDPMQSIYQFREAEVGLFLRARDHGVGSVALRPLNLRRNFRSAPSLIEWVNRHCERMFPARDDPRLAAIRYLPALAARPELAGEVRVHPLADPGPEFEAREIALLARACRRRDPACSIAILVSARQQVPPIAAALQAAGFVARGVRLEPLQERPVVRDLCSLARALAHPGDRNAWLSVLHAPTLGLTLAQLQDLAENRPATAWELMNDAQTLAQLDDDARARLARARAALAPSISGPERALPLWQRVDRCWLRLGGPAACGEERALLDVQEFILALARQPRQELLAGDAFDDFAADLYAAAAPAADAIEILTMHGAKGLEWDVVIVPGLGRVQRADREPLLHWLELPGNGPESELLLAPIGAAGTRGTRSLASYIHYLRKRRARLERARVLYVAATRARRELHWFAATPMNAVGEVSPRAGTTLELLWPTVAREFSAAPAAAAIGAGTAAARALAATTAAAAASTVAPVPPPSMPWRLPAGWSPEGLPAPVAARRLELSLREAQALEYDWVGIGSRAVGTIVHAELLRLAQLPQLPPKPPPDNGRYGTWLAELGVPAADREAATRRVVEALERTLADERGRWLLGGGHREAHGEWRLTGLHEGRIVNVSVDRFLVDAQGECWLVDYKTSSHEGGSLAEFLERETERHRPQLQRYAALVRQLAPGPVRAALYYPLLGEFREVDVKD